MKWWLLTVALVLGASPVLGSDARTQSLGVQFEYLEDYILFRQFPTVIARAGNLITASPGGRNLGDHSVGVILAPGAGRSRPWGTWALFLNQDGDNNKNAHVEAAWAGRVGETTLGAGFLWFGSEERSGQRVVSPVDYPANRGQTAFTLGSRAALGARTSVETALEAAWITWERRGVPFLSDTQSAGHVSFRFSTRLIHEIDSHTKAVPLAHFIHQDLTERGADGDSFTDSGNLGVALRHRPREGDTLIGGLALNYFKSLRQLEEGPEVLKRWDVPALFLSMEVELARWLSARAGATKTFDVLRDESPTADTVESVESRYFFGMGVGIRVRDLIIDAQVNPDALYTGGYFLSGETTQLFSRVTLTYPF